MVGVGTAHRLFAVIHRRARSMSLLLAVRRDTVSLTLLRRRRFTMKSVFVSVAMASLFGCGGGGGGSTAPPTNQGTNTPPAAGGVSVNNNVFSPSAKTVGVGTTIQWAWNSCSGDPYGGAQTCTSHSVTFDDGTGSATQDQGTFSKTFNGTGTFNYHCSVHGTAMSGRITVQ
jgi:plastocyanin